MNQPLLDPQLYPSVARQMPVQTGRALPMDKLSKDAKAVFEKWPAYISALGRKPSACYVNRKQAATIEKSLRRQDDRLRVTDFTFDGLPIKVIDA